MFDKKYKKLITIEGMKCAHCAKKVEDTLLSISGVKKVKVNLEEKSALITSKEELSDEVIKEKIQSLDYSILEIKTI